MSNFNLKESLKYNISVEGINCELLYFEKLEELINSCDYAQYKVKFNVKKKNPSSYAKSRINVYSQKGKKGEGFIKYFHIQDIEDFNDEIQRGKFFSLIDEINMVKKECNISQYDLGYTNFTFELWMILHKKNMNFPVEHRKKYCEYINSAYGKKYKHIDDYKTESEFKSCLNQISIEDVVNAVERGNKIRLKHVNDNDHLDTYGNFNFYRDNPDLSIHLVVGEILKDCGIIKR